MYILTVIRFNCGVRNLLRFLTTSGAYTTHLHRHVLYTSYLHCYYFIMSKNSPVELRGFEPRTPCLQSRCSSQLSYSPHSAHHTPVGLGGLEPPTSRLSGVRSNHLSYKPRSAIRAPREHAPSLNTKQIACNEPYVKRH